MRYSVELKEKAREGLSKLLRSEPKSYKKALNLIRELYEHPTTGTGQPEQLKGCGTNRWSRRISKKHRLVYEIHDSKVLVIVLASYGHYDDK